MKTKVWDAVFFGSVVSDKNKETNDAPPISGKRAARKLNKL